MQKLLGYIGLALCVILFLIIGFLYTKVNLKKTNRPKQLLCIPFALLYCVAAYILMGTILRPVNALADKLIELLPFLETIALSKILVCLLNILLIAGFIIIKGILLAPFSRLKHKQKQFLSPVIGVFYEFDQGMKSWVLKPSRVQLRKYFSSFYFAALIISVVVMLGIVLADHNIKITGGFLPVFLIVMLGEIKFFLGGLTKNERLSDYEGDDDIATARIDYHKMRDVYRQYFGDRVMFEDSDYLSESNTGSLTKTVDEFLNSDHVGVKALGNYYAMRIKGGFCPDINYMNSSRDLVTEKSVLFSNPFYKDMNPLYVFPHELLPAGTQKMLGHTR